MWRLSAQSKLRSWGHSNSKFLPVTAKIWNFWARRNLVEKVWKAFVRACGNVVTSGTFQPTFVLDEIADPRQINPIKRYDNNNANEGTVAHLLFIFCGLGRLVFQVLMLVTSTFFYFLRWLRRPQKHSVSRTVSGSAVRSLLAFILRIGQTSQQQGRNQSAFVCPAVCPVVVRVFSKAFVRRWFEIFARKILLKYC